MLVRLEVTYEFCIEAPSESAALEIFRAQGAIAVSDERCGVVSGPTVSRATSDGDFREQTLDEVPLGAFDYTLRERLAQGNV